MKKLVLAAIISTSTVMTFAQKSNPLLADFKTIYQTTPFTTIDVEDFVPAIDSAMAQARQEIEMICNNRATPDFDNTIVALEHAGKDLDKVLNIFFPLNSALSSDRMMDISMDIMPKISEYSTSITLNTRLWDKIKYVWEHRDLYNLNPEDQMLLKRTYDNFVQSGALLQGEDREKYKKIDARLSELTTLFSQNVLKELNTYEIWLAQNDLGGLPEGIVEEAATLAKAKGREGEYMFTLAQPTYIAFMKYSDRRDLREKMYKLYMGRNIKGEYSNVEVMKEIADLRRQLANLLGYPTYAHYSQVNTMAEKPENVYDLLYKLRDAYKPVLKQEFDQLNGFANELTGDKNFKIQPWDYSYYANKLKKAKYDYDEELLRPYFELGNVVDGVFGLATKLYGLTFEECKDIDTYHTDVKAYEVKDADGSYLGVLYTDFFPRDSKRPGAWMTEFKGEWIESDSTSSRPHISIVMNFTKPTETKPSLLTPYEVSTFLHEFGHALHGLLANTKYASLSGTNVYRDFVELPSQFNENYLTQREFLDGFASHYLTGEPIPQEYVDKIIESAQFGAAYACLRQLSFGLVDMAWHSITEPVTDAMVLETEAASSVAMFEPIEDTMMSPQFSHIFGGGYAAGYYSYKWAEVLDADAFAKFQENGIFDRKTADEFRHNVLEKGGTEHPAELYRRFRGCEPTIDALLRRDGVLK